MTSLRRADGITFLPSRTVFAFFLLLSCIPYVSAIEDGDDFSNNLFSDLGPILALFGEQVAMQFMACSLGWADNILFAMAPLGVITAIVGAIRIGGPAWLMAIIGRARESRGEAERELTTSTSADVCELWNGNSVVRLMGSAKIVTLLYFPGSAGEEGGAEGKLYTIQEAFDAGLLEQKISRRHRNPPTAVRRTSTMNRPWWERKNSKGMMVVGEEDEDEDEEARVGREKREKKEHAKSTSETPLDLSPNVALNLHPPTKRYEVQLYAVIGVLIQAAVLIFSGFATYDKTLSEKVKTEAARDYGFPLMAAGTLFLVLGMLICAWIIESSTREIKFRSKKKFRIMWLQRGEAVSDQAFDSFAIFGQGERESLVISRLDQSRHNRRLSTETWVVLGASTSIAGFVVQFVGFRAVNWSASLAQLAATGIMIILRAVVRRDMSKPPRAQKVPNGYEMDWLATRLPRYPEELWGIRDGQSVTGPGPNDPQIWSESCHDWGIQSAPSHDKYAFEIEPDMSSLVNKAVELREDIGRLIGWETKESPLAMALANAMEVVLKSCTIEAPGNSDSLSLPLWGLYGRPIYIDVRKAEGSEGQGWLANSADILAILSLWIYSTLEHSDIPKESDKLHVKSALPKNKEDWLRIGGETSHPQSLRLLGQKKTMLEKIGWYERNCIDETKRLDPGTRPEYMVAIEQLNVLTPKEKKNREKKKQMTRIFDIYPTRKLSKKVERSSQLLQFASHRVVGTVAEDVPNESTPNITSTTSTSPSYVVSISHGQLASLFAQDIFTAFIWAVSKIADPLSGEITINSLDPIDIRHEGLSRFLRDISLFAPGLGSLGDIYLSLLPPLIHHNKLVSEKGAQKALHKAIIDHDPILLKFLLESFNVNVNSLDPTHRTALHHASLLAFPDLITILHEFHADPNIQDTTGHTALHLAAESGYDAIIRQLMKSLNADSHLTTQTGQTALHLAVLKKRWSSTKFLLTLGSTIFTSDATSKSPLDHAILLPDIDPKILDLLISSAAQIPDIPNRTAVLSQAFFWASSRGQTSTMQKLLNAGASADYKNADGSTALHIAAEKGDATLIRVLTNRNADRNVVNAVGQTPLHLAVLHSQTDAVEALAREMSALEKVLDNAGRNPLHLAAEVAPESDENDRVISNLVKERKMNVNCADADGNTVLHRAARARRLQTMKTLGRLGANVKVVNNDGNTPLHLYIDPRFGGGPPNKATLKYLIKQLKGDVNAKNKAGETPAALLRRSLVDRPELVRKWMSEFGASEEVATPDESGPSTGKPVEGNLMDELTPLGSPDSLESP